MEFLTTFLYKAKKEAARCSHLRKASVLGETLKIRSCSTTLRPSRATQPWEYMEGMFLKKTLARTGLKHHIDLQRRTLSNSMEFLNQL